MPDTIVTTNQSISSSTVVTTGQPSVPSSSISTGGQQSGNSQINDDTVTSPSPVIDILQDQIDEAEEAIQDIINPPNPEDSDPITAPSTLGSTGVYTKTAGTYASTIDPSINNIGYKTCTDNGQLAARGKLHTLFILAGYNQSILALTDELMERYSRYGFRVVGLNMRGRDGALGSRDDSGREIHDIKDGMAHILSVFAASSTGRKFIDGYSGGGGNVDAAICKLTDFVDGFVSFFSITDYGKDLADSFWIISPADRPTMTAAIGQRDASIIPYRARNSVEAVGKILALDGAPPMWIFWDTADTNVPTSSRLKDAITADGGRSKLHYHQSGPGDAIRWLHGYPETSPNLILAEWRFVPELLSTSVGWTIPAVGHGVVIGYMCSSRFEIWLGTADVPIKYGAGGGTVHSIDVQWNMLTKTFFLTPLSGSCFIEIHRQVVIDGINTTQIIRQALTAPIEVDLESTANVVSPYEAFPNAIFDFDAGYGITSPLPLLDVTSWVDRINGYILTEATNRPLYVVNPGDNLPLLSFDAANTERLIRNTNLLNPNTVYTLMIIYVKLTAGLGTLFAQASAISDTPFIRVYKSDGFATHDARDDGAVFGEAGVAAAGDWHCTFARFTAADLLRNTTDGGSASAAGPPGDKATTRVSVGTFFPVSGHAFPFGGYIAQIVGFQADLTDNERDAAKVIARTRWGIGRVP